MTHYIRATKRPSTRFNSPIESLVYSLAPNFPVTLNEIVDVVLRWVGQHPEDGPIRDPHEVRLAVENLTASGWFRTSLIAPSKTT